MIGAERQAALDKIHALEDRQHALREKTKTTKLTDPPQRELIEEQNAIRKALGELAEELTDQPRAQTHLDQAKAAAGQATTEIFDGEKEQAVGEQSKVLGHLAALAEELENLSEIDNSDKSADDYAKQVRDLEAAKKDLAEAKPLQDSAAEKTAQSKPKEAAAPEKEVAKKAEAAAKDRDLPENVKSRLAEAGEAANRRRESFGNPGQELAGRRNPSRPGTRPSRKPPMPWNGRRRKSRRPSRMPSAARPR